MKCKNCGSEIFANSIYCPFCKQPVAFKSENQFMAEKQAKENKKAEKRAAREKKIEAERIAKQEKEQIKQQKAEIERQKRELEKEKIAFEKEKEKIAFEKEKTAQKQESSTDKIVDNTNSDNETEQALQEIEQALQDGAIIKYQTQQIPTSRKRVQITVTKDTITCRYCGEEVDRTLKNCPHCAEPTEKIFRKKMPKVPFREKYKEWTKGNKEEWAEVKKKNHDKPIIFVLVFYLIFLIVYLFLYPVVAIARFNLHSSLISAAILL